MTFEHFLKTHEDRINSYIRRYARAFYITGTAREDLKQEAYMAAFRVLKYWKAIPGGKSAFNWCAGPMRAAMERAVRREYGQRPASKEPIWDRRAPYDDTNVRYAATDSMEGLENMLDLKTAMALDRKPQHIVRLVMAALSPMSEVEFAKSHGITKQSMWASNKNTRARLRRRLDCAS